MLQNQVALMLSWQRAVGYSHLPEEARKDMKCVMRQERGQGKRETLVYEIDDEYCLMGTLRALLKGTRSLEDVTDTRGEDKGRC